MKVSAIIPTKNRTDDLKECLDTLLMQTLLPDEVIIVDNSTNDETEQYIKDWKNSAGFKLIYIKQIEGGTAVLRNIGIDNSIGDIIFLLDDDIVLDKEYIAIIMDIFTGDTAKEIGGITGLGGCDLKDIGTLGFENPAEVKDILRDMGDLGQRLQELALDRYGRDIFKQSTANYFIWKIAKWARDAATTIFLMESRQKGRVLPSGFRSDFPRGKLAVPFVYVDTLPGCVCYRREVLDEFKFDENLELFPYAVSEDQELSMRVGRKYKLVATSMAKLIHKRSPGGRVDLRGQFASIVVNHHYIVRKNMNHPINMASFWWATLGILISSLVTLLFRPSRESWQRLAGTIEGIRMCATRWKGIEN